MYHSGFRCINYMFETLKDWYSRIRGKTSGFPVLEALQRPVNPLPGLRSATLRTCHRLLRAAPVKAWPGSQPATSQRTDHQQPRKGPNPSKMLLALVFGSLHIEDFRLQATPNRPAYPCRKNSAERLKEECRREKLFQYRVSIFSWGQRG